jgi:hypothetical protein
MITVGGNLIDNPGDVSTKTADLVTAKILWSSVLSTPGARYMAINVKNLYLGTPLDRPEYLVRFYMDLIQEEIIIVYKLYELLMNKDMYMRKSTKACKDYCRREC